MVLILANRILLGKNVNTNHGHSTGSAGFGLYVSRPTKNVLTCTADELIFNTDNGSVTDVSRIIGIFQLAPITVGNATTTTTNLTSGSTATIDISNVTFNLGFGFSGFGGVPVAQSSTASANVTYTNNFGNNTITIKNNTTSSFAVKTFLAPRYSNLALF